MACFYESYPVEDAPFLEVPSFQYGSFGVTVGGRRNNYSLLEVCRPFFFRGYYWQGLGAPRQSLLAANAVPGQLAPFQQIEDRYTIPRGSWILGASGFSAQPEGFQFQLFDVGSKDYALTVGGWMIGATDAMNSTDPDQTVGHWLPEPYYVVSAPGMGGAVLQLKLVNASPASNDVGLVIHCVSPFPKNQGKCA